MITLPFYFSLVEKRAELPFASGISLLKCWCLNFCFFPGNSVHRFHVPFLVSHNLAGLPILITRRGKSSFSPSWITFPNSRVMSISRISSGRLPSRNTLPVVKCSLLVAASFPTPAVPIPDTSPQHEDFSLLTQCSCFLLTFDIYKAGAKLNLPITLLNVPF